MAVSGRWWKGTTWVRVIQRMPPWMVAQLEIWKKLIELTEKEALKNASQLKAAAPGELFFGEGELTHELGIDRCAAFQKRPTGGQLFWTLSEREHNRSEPSDGFDHQARQPEITPLDGRTGLAGEPLSAPVPGWPMEAAAPRSQSLSRGAQESHRSAGPSSVGGPVAHRHRPCEG
jgi:hypothetical protein